MDYFHGGEKPYLISGADDRLVKIWDYQVCKPTYIKDRIRIDFYKTGEPDEKASK